VNTGPVRGRSGISTGQVDPVKRARPLSARLLRAGARVIRRTSPSLEQALRRARQEGRWARPSAPPPEVVVERTNLGPEADEVVAALKRRQKPVGLDADYDFLRENFDHLNFALQARAKNSITPYDPIATYLRNGAEAINNPDVNFSMAAYLERYPEKLASREHPYLAWLKRGRAAGEIADPAPQVEKMAQVLDLSPRELVDALVERRTDLQQRLRTGKLGEMLARAAEVDPLVSNVWPEASRPVLLPVTSPLTVRQMALLQASQAEAGFRRAQVLLVVHKPRWGGGRRMEGHIAHALAGRVAPEDIVVIYTDESGVAPSDRFPDGVREIDFATHAADMGADWQQHTLVMLLRSFHADAIVNVNSGVLHRAMRSYGSALAMSERVFPVFLCNERDEMGNWYGWPASQSYRLFDQVTNFITDSEYLAQWFDDVYQLDARAREKIRVLQAPVDATLPVASSNGSPDASRRPTVFWAGRWDRQKKVALVLEIARLMPDVDFRMWGESVLQQSRLRQLPENVKAEGTYAAFRDLDLGQADVWLYTSGWDGVPSILLEVAMTGVPIVGSLVGGTGEVLSKADSWPVEDIDNAHDYVSGVRAVLADRAEARRRALALRERLLGQRSEAAFAEQVADLLLVSGETTA
jgi:glycosyltransferase involved in cell wall biosynthesis